MIPLFADGYADFLRNAKDTNESGGESFQIRFISLSAEHGRRHLTSTGKSEKVMFTNAVPQAACAASAMLSSHTEPTYKLSRSPSLQSRTLA